MVRDAKPLNCGELMNESISVIIPAYNAEKYIEQCINSVMQQSFQDLEIIVVIDDTSKDNTNEIVAQITNTDKRIKVLQQHKKKLGEARNGGLDIAHGDYILFLDADDWIEPNCCEIAMTNILEYKSDLLFFNYIKEYGSKSIPHISYRKDKLEYSKKKQEFSIYDMKNCTAWGKLYSSQLIGNERFNSEIKESEDVEFNFRIYSKVQNAVYIKQPLLHYRVLESSAVHGFDPDKVGKFEYTVSLVRENTLGVNQEKTDAYFSFLAIVYIVICQNCVYLDKSASIKAKLIKVRGIGNRQIFKELFLNIGHIKLPISRKIIPIMGKLNMGIGILAAIGFKQKLEKGRRS